MKSFHAASPAKVNYLPAAEFVAMSARTVPGTIVTPTAQRPIVATSFEGRNIVTCEAALELSRQIGVRIHWRPNGLKDAAEVLEN